MGAAEDAGATVRRGAVVRTLETGENPAVSFECDGNHETESARWVVGADGRASDVRRWSGFQLSRDAERLVIAGVLLEGTHVPSDSIHVFRESSRGEGALMFPLGEGTTRAYFIYRKQGKRRGLSGRGQVRRFLDSCRELGVADGWLDDAQPAGPLAEYDGADFWAPHPYRQNVALIGAAAASNDPAWGQRTVRHAARRQAFA